MTELRMLHLASPDRARPRTPITAIICGALVSSLALLLVLTGLAVPAGSPALCRVRHRRRQRPHTSVDSGG